MMIEFSSSHRMSDFKYRSTVSHWKGWGFRFPRYRLFLHQNTMVYGLEDTAGHLARLISHSRTSYRCPVVVN